MPAPPGTLSGSELLDQPPPSPALSDGMNPGNPGISALLGPQQPGGGGLHSSMIPPDVLTGMMQAAMKIAEDINAFAQMTPDLASDWAQVQASLQAVMSKVVLAGSGPVSPNATGPGFPGGGIERGGLPLASGGMGV